jgi:hypothetical protein
MQNAVSACSVVQSFNLTFDKRGTHEGFVRGEIYFIDGSVLHMREYVDVEMDIDRLMYTYHYVNPSNLLVFRYDNTGHHKRLNLPTYPHHKHLDGANEVIASSAPDLVAVLSEIEAMLPLSD